MTTVAYKNGVLAADSRSTTESDEGGSRVFICQKLFRRTIKLPDDSTEEVILATCGDAFAGMVFVDWYGSGTEAPTSFLAAEADFTVLVLRKDGLFEFDQWCRGVKILDDCYAVGSGTKAAMGAMLAGASATRAVEIACKIDPFTAPPVVSMRLASAKKPRVPKVRTAPDTSGQDPGRQG